MVDKTECEEAYEYLKELTGKIGEHIRANGNRFAVVVLIKTENDIFQFTNLTVGSAVRLMATSAKNMVENDRGCVEPLGKVQ